MSTSCLIGLLILWMVKTVLYDISVSQQLLIWSTADLGPYYQQCQIWGPFNQRLLHFSSKLFSVNQMTLTDFNVFQNISLLILVYTTKCPVWTFSLGLFKL